VTVADIIEKLRKVADDLEAGFTEPSAWEVDQEEIVLVGSEIRVTGRAKKPQFETIFGVRA
jgi:tRNA A58 N-methylase Trm61